jgi:hypothetical protein
LAYPVYRKVINKEVSNGLYLLYSKTNQNFISIRVIKFWKKLEEGQATGEKVMRFANHFQ